YLKLAQLQYWLKNQQRKPFGRSRSNLVTFQGRVPPAYQPRQTHNHVIPPQKRPSNRRPWPLILPPKEAETLIKTEIDKATKAGFSLELYQMQLEQPEKQILDELAEHLQQQKWDAVAFGFGIRGDREQTPLFEKVVNMAVENVRPTPRLAFPVLPDKIVEAFERVFPESSSEQRG
ncbi:hypothetical protein LTR70_010389, partial [Exophiala xenobiotica]